jgi:hypothetical protein
LSPAFLFWDEDSAQKSSYDWQVKTMKKLSITSFEQALLELGQQ